MSVSTSVAAALQSAGKGGAKGGKAGGKGGPGKGALPADGSPPDWAVWRCWSCGEFHSNPRKQECRTCQEVRLEHPLTSPGVHQAAAAPRGAAGPPAGAVADAEQRRAAALKQTGAPALGAAPKAGAKGAGKGKGAVAGPAAAALPQPFGAWAPQSPPPPPTKREARRQGQVRFLEQAFRKYMPAEAEPEESACADNGESSAAVTEDGWGEDRMEDDDAAAPEDESQHSALPANLEEQRAYLTVMVSTPSGQGDPCGDLPYFKGKLAALPPEPVEGGKYLDDASRLSGLADAAEKERAALEAQVGEMRGALAEKEAELGKKAAELARIRRVCAAAASRAAADLDAGDAGAHVPPASMAPQMAAAMEKLAEESAAKLAETTAAGTVFGQAEAARTVLDKALHEAFLAGLSARPPQAAQPAMQVGGSSGSGGTKRAAPPEGDAMDAEAPGTTP